MGDTEPELLETQFQATLAFGLPVVVMACDEARARALEMTERGASGYVRKPLALRDLKALLRSTCETRRLKQELENTQQRLAEVSGLHDLVGSSAPMQMVFNLVRKVSISIPPC